MIKWKQCGSACLTSAYSFCLEDRNTVLNYGKLEINESGLTSIAYESLQNETDMIVIAETKEKLLEYCKLDTLAMVRILEKLSELLGE